MHVRQTDERPRPQRWCPVTTGCERPFEPLPSLLELTALRPEPKQRAGKFESLLGEGRRRQRPFERRADVLQFYLDSPETVQLTMVAEDVQYPAELVEEVVEMPLARPVGGAPLYEPFARVLADRLEEAVPPLTGDIVLDTDEGFADQLSHLGRFAAQPDVEAGGRGRPQLNANSLAGLGALGRRA